MTFLCRALLLYHCKWGVGEFVIEGRTRRADPARVANNRGPGDGRIKASVPATKERFHASKGNVIFSWRPPLPLLPEVSLPKPETIGLAMRGFLCVPIVTIVKSTPSLSSKDLLSSAVNAQFTLKTKEIIFITVNLEVRSDRGYWSHSVAIKSICIITLLAHCVECILVVVDTPN